MSEMSGADSAKEQIVDTDTSVELMPPADDESVPVGNDDLAALLARRERWKPNRWTWALIGMLILGVGFMGGALVAKQLGLSNSTATGFAFPGGARPNFGTGGGTPNFGGGNFPGGAGGFPGGSAGTGSGLGAIGESGSGGSGASGTTGTLKLVSKGKLYMTDANGQTIIVTVPSSASVTIAKPGALAAIKPGDTVTVQGASSDGGTTMTATSIAAGPAVASSSASPSTAPSGASMTSPSNAPSNSPTTQGAAQ